jgi:endonuclease I/V8-like Glu-specific endopeptidase
MPLNEQIIKATERRYRQRVAPRNETLRKIEEGAPLSADTPERVEQRLSRLARAGVPGRPSMRGITVDTSASGNELPDTLPPGRASDPGALERIIGKSDLIGINYLEMGLRVSRTVGRVRIRSASGQVVGYGTGFMISPRLLLTNNHVLTSKQSASYSQVEFNYQDGPDGRLLTSTIFDLKPDEFFITSVELDFTMVAVSEQPHDGSGSELSEFGWNRLIEEQGKVILGEYLNIIQHPNGEPKQIALRENQLIDLPENFLQYQTDTAPGSSGSPVFNDQWEVVGLHHSGVPRRDDQQRIIARDGSVWTQQMGDDQIDWIANEGIRASRIARFIQDQTLSDSERRLRNQIFEAEAERSGKVRTPSVPARTASAAPASASSFKSGDAAQSADAGSGAAVWTIPLEVSIRLGQPLAPGQAPAITSVTAGAQSGRVEPPVRKSAPPAQAENEEVREALRELEEAPAKTYYDEEQDLSDREIYYEEVSQSLKPTEFYKRLSRLVTETHEVKFPYKPMKQVYPWVDLQPNLKLRSVYSGQEFEPEELIQEDFRVEQERALRMREMLLTESSLASDRLMESIDLLEATLPYNCEHVVPQSWFGKREPMRGDIHHLFACEMRCNSFRGNTPFYDFDDAEETVLDDCGRREANKFEPGAGKGTIARAVLYFLLRYPGEINSNAQEYTEDRLKILLNWHLEDPVSLHEQHRNMAIYYKQGNRNPLIDFPEWAERIAFKQGLG